MEHILQGRGRGVEVKAVVGPGGFLPVGCRKQLPCRVAGAKPGDQASWGARVWLRSGWWRAAGCKWLGAEYTEELGTA